MNLEHTVVWYHFALYNVFTPARNADDIRIHGSNKEHTITLKNTKKDMWHKRKSVYLMALTQLLW